MWTISQRKTFVENEFKSQVIQSISYVLSD